MQLQLEHGHTPDAIAERLRNGAKPSYLRDWVYGGIDGAVTTFAVIAGVAGAGLAAHIIVILGLANVVADGFSMAASNYSGTQTELDEAARFRAIEERHIRLEPEGEREEVRQILAAKGLSGPSLEEAVHAITSNHETWIETMLAAEYGITGEPRSPVRAALATFCAFMLAGLLPLMPYVLGATEAFGVAGVLTAMTFFAIGSLKSYFVARSWWRSGLETMAIGLSAAGLAFLVGHLLRGLVPAGVGG